MSYLTLTRRAAGGACSALLLTAALAATTPAPSSAQLPPDLDIEEVTNLPDTVAIRNAGDGSNRLFLVQQQGIIRIYDVDTDTLLTTPFLDIQSLVDDGGNEQGLLGLAFHPNYDTNGLFFVNYTYDPGPGLDRTRIARYEVSAGNPNVADASSAGNILEIEQDFGNHNGGDIHFGPDGFLYIGMGDGGSGGDPNNRSQDPDELLGKMLRIDVDPLPRGGGPDCGLVGNYSVPASNPFVGDASTCDEIWALGVRNPWRFSFDRATGDLFIGDVGQSAREEISYQPAASTGGENYGWRCYEGNEPFNTSGCGSIGDYTFPILDYNRTGGACSVTGGFRYRGAIDGFGGYYVYADYCNGRIYAANNPGGVWSTQIWRDTSLFITTFGEDESGELYLSNQSGNIYRFTGPSGSIFEDGFESADLLAWSSSTVD